MASKRPLPKHTLAINLRAAMAYAKIKAPQIAKIASVDRKTVTNWLNGIYDPQPEKLDAVADAMGFEGWQLLRADFDPKTKVSHDKVSQLLELFNAADEYGKESILRVAQLAGGKH